jgi:hypothetical protein
METFNVLRRPFAAERRKCMQSRCARAESRRVHRHTAAYCRAHGGLGAGGLESRTEQRLNGRVQQRAAVRVHNEGRIGVLREGSG